MRVIIAGSRTLSDWRHVSEAMAASGFVVTEVVSGGCRGVDRLGQQWAADRSLPVRLCAADWKAHGRAAGPIRNREMASAADALVAVWDGRSRGTADMIAAARAAGLRVHVHLVAA